MHPTSATHVSFGERTFYLLVGHGSRVSPAAREGPTQGGTWVVAVEKHYSNPCYGDACVEVAGKVRASTIRASRTRAFSLLAIATCFLALAWRRTHAC